MKIFVIVGSVPFRTHGKKGATATPVVNATLIRELLKLGHEVQLQYIFQPTHPTETLNADEEAEMQYMREDGVTVLPPMKTKNVMPPPRTERLRTLRLLLSPKKCLEYFYPAVRLAPLMHQLIRESKPDVILTILSPQGVAATHGIKDMPRVSFQGDVDYFVMQKNLSNTEPFQRESTRGLVARMLGRLDQRLRLALYIRTHVRLMNELAVIANIAANTDYAALGHRRSFYIGHTWPDPGREPLREGLKHVKEDLPAEAPQERRPVKIIGHVGTLYGSGSTYGLRFLLRDVMPHLEKAMQGRPFEVHIIGGGSIPPLLEPLLSQPHVRRRGFVPDLEKELLESDVMLLLNNAGPSEVAFAFTRHFVAWSMGQCLIAHTKSRLAIPELEHGKNVLLGETGEEVAHLIAQATSDRALNKRIREGGRLTYETHFLPTMIAVKLDSELRRVVGA